MGIFKRIVKDIVKAGVPHFHGPVFEVLEDIHDGNQNVRFIREAVTTETVNELAARRAGQVEDAMFIGRVVRVCRKRHPKTE